jgi:hypothetical protein
MTYKEYCENELNYKVRTTYFEDFSIAERFGENAIVGTFKNAMHNKDYKTITELCMVLNHKMWFTYQSKPRLAKLYEKLWQQCDQWCCDNLQGEELKYFYKTTD